MRIVCPQCGYSRDIPTDRIPAASNMATCPKCRLRFRFRGAPLPPVEPGVDHEPVYPPRPSRPAAPAPEFTAAEANVPWAPPERVPERIIDRSEALPRPAAQRLPDPGPSETASAAEPPAYEETAPPSWERLAGEPPIVAAEEAQPVEPDAVAGVPPAEEPVPAEPVFWPDEATAAPEDVSGAMSGSDSVRDIWSRLQAMGADADPAVGKGREAKGAQGRVSWENFEQKGAISAFAGTVKDILFAPGDFFDGLPPMVGKARPLIFTIVVSILVMLFALIWEYFGLKLGGLRDLGHTEGFQELGAGPAGGLALLGLAPVLTAGFVFLDAGLSYLLLGLLRTATKGFDETFRMVCYAGCPWIVAVLPVPYPYLLPVLLIWTMALQAISLRKLHQAGYPQVLASILVKWSLYFMASFAVLHVLIMRG